MKVEMIYEITVKCKDTLNQIKIEKVVSVESKRDGNLRKNPSLMFPALKDAFMLYNTQITDENSIVEVSFKKERGKFYNIKTKLFNLICR